MCFILFKNSSIHSQLCFCSLFFAVCPSSTIPVTFDDLSGGSVPNGYKNINWSNALLYSTSANTCGYYTGVVTRPFAIYVSTGLLMTMTSANGSLFSLYSAAVASAWMDNLQLTAIGYQSNTVVSSQTFTVQVFTLSIIAFSGYSGLDKVTFSASGGTPNSAAGGSSSWKQFTMDDICLTFM